MSLVNRLLGANPSIQVSTLLSGTLTTPSSKNAFVNSNSYESIQTVTVGSGGTASVSFTSIPSTYKNLQIRGIAKGAQTTYGASNMYIKINDDAGSSYNSHYAEAYYNTDATSGVRSSGTASSTTAICLHNSLVGTYSGMSNVFSIFVIDIHDYVNTSKYKTIRTLGGWNSNAYGYSATSTNVWRSSSAITKITLSEETGGNIAQYSHFALYGIKG